MSDLCPECRRGHDAVRDYVLVIRDEHPDCGSLYGYRVRAYSAGDALAQAPYRPTVVRVEPYERMSFSRTGHDPDDDDDGKERQMPYRQVVQYRDPTTPRSVVP